MDGSRGGGESIAEVRKSPVILPRAFTDEGYAWHLFREMRWDEDVSCVFCGGDEVKRHSRRGGGIFYYRCKFCGKNFTDATGTMFHRLRLPLTTVFRFAHLLHSGTPVNRLHKRLGIAKTAAFRLAKKLRSSSWFDDLASKLNKEIATDPQPTES